MTLPRSRTCARTYSLVIYSSISYDSLRHFHRPSYVSWECPATFRHISVIKPPGKSTKASEIDLHLEIGTWCSYSIDTSLDIASVVHPVLSETAESLCISCSSSFWSSSECPAPWRQRFHDDIVCSRLYLEVVNLVTLLSRVLGASSRNLGAINGVKGLCKLTLHSVIEWSHIGRQTERERHLCSWYHCRVTRLNLQYST